MTKRLTTAQLLARRIEEEDLTLPGGGVVLVRGVTRQEFHDISQVRDDRRREYLTVSRGLVEPSMTPEQVAQWAEQGATGDIQEVVITIGRLSRMIPEAAKDATKSVP